MNRNEQALAPYREAIRYHGFAQYILSEQLGSLKKKMAAAGMELIGDLPFYVSLDSDDVYFHRDCFALDAADQPLWIAGVPPDYFAREGQRWGNPIYDWENLKKTGYAFWIERIRAAGSLYDRLRLDHFRAFDTYWRIPAGEPTAVHGEWIVNDGDSFFRALLPACPDIHLLAEDLGELRPEVHALRDRFRLPGMHVLEFDFFGRGRPHEVTYIGTHDNLSMVSWFEQQSPEYQASIRRRLQRCYPHADIYEAILRYALDMPDELVVISAVDLLLDRRRINLPGTIGSPNWEFKLTDWHRFARRIRIAGRLCQASGR